MQMQIQKISRMLSVIYWYSADVLYALDLLINAICGGERHETISARWGKIGKKVRLWYLACRMLHWFDREHCEKSAAKYEQIKKASR